MPQSWAPGKSHAVVKVLSSDFPHGQIAKHEKIDFSKPNIRELPIAICKDCVSEGNEEINDAGAGKNTDSSNLGFLAFAFISGYNVDKFLDKLEKIAGATWGIGKPGEKNLKEQS